MSRIIRDTAPSTLDRIRKSLVGLKMARTLEVLDDAVARLEKGDTNALEAFDTLLAEELTIREPRRAPGHQASPIEASGRQARNLAQGATRPRLQRLGDRQRNPLWPEPLDRPVPLPRRWPHRDRLQHR